MNIVYDSCQPIIIDAPSATLTELASIDEAARMWNDVLDSELVRNDLTDAPRLPLHFESAALAFYGLYDDERGVITINAGIKKDSERAITIAHEIGHAFGLWHVPKDQRPSVMNDNNLTVTPTTQDVRDVQALWGDCFAMHTASEAPLN